MKSSPFSISAGGFAAVALFSCCVASFTVAHESGKPHSHDHDHHHDHEHGHGAGHHATILVPEDPADLWAHINAYSAVVAASAASGDIDLLHKQQINLGALIGELDHQMTAVEEKKRKRVAGMLNNTKRALGKLHESTDAKDEKSIKKSVKTLGGVLKLLKAQYPDAITTGMAKVEDDLGPHEGMIAAFDGGYIELKLHDDKGDLELWIAKDAGITQPYDISASEKITVSFSDAKQASATLAVRNMGKNEDEDGNATMREGQTNYFIYPGDSGESAAWLQGKSFKSQVTVSFAGKQTASFLLIPHGHHGHDHEH